ncbi:MAG: CRISPR-associated helicase Cas3' [Kiritimatiellia bacterium]
MSNDEMDKVIDQLLAHIDASRDGNARIETLEEHMRLTAEIAARLAEPLGLSATADLLGRIHDLGKTSNEFQAYIRASVGDTEENEDTTEVQGRRRGPDHSTAAARWLYDKAGLPAEVGGLLGYVVAGHHAGLPDGASDSHGCEEWRIRKKPICEWESIAQAQLPRELFSLDGRTIFAELTRMARPDVLSLANRIRMLFSVLVDADFLATEHFMDAGRSSVRSAPQLGIADLERRLMDHLRLFDAARQASPSPVDGARQDIRMACLAAAERKPGLFTLEVPTGGGKTLSSMAFALKHARLHGLRRVIYVIPFTSIIEQNAEVFRRIFGEDAVLEHHSNRDPDGMSTRARLLTENWDAPIVVTTNVQFFESLYANRSSRCRKLHNLAKSVIVLDEAQSLPALFLRPCLHALDDLMCNYGSSVVICTATLPAFFKGELKNAPKRNGSWSGLAGNVEGRRDIAAGLSLDARLCRTKGERIQERLTDEELAQRLNDETSVLAIVSTRMHARRLFEELKSLDDSGSVFHLSAQMCPAHRLTVINVVKSRLEAGLPCRLVSTQLIEAGVDIDFPCVYREIAGCDSIIQAAGRCNREGRLKTGRVVVFESAEPHAIPPGDIRMAAQMGYEVLSLPECQGNFLSTDSVRRYFQLRYSDLDSADRLDAKNIFGRFVCEGTNPFGFAFKTCADDFCLIPETGLTVFVPYGEKGRELCEQLRSTYAIGEVRKIARELCRYAVTVHGVEPRDRDGNLYADRVHDLFWVMTSPEQNYSDEFGLSIAPMEGVVVMT